MASAKCRWHGKGLVIVQAGEQEKQKSYLATCCLPCPVTRDMLDKISATENLVLQQRTPTRVEHRRAMLVRTCSPAQLTATLSKLNFMCLLTFAAPIWGVLAEFLCIAGA